ncbi:hypothetical protein GCM10009838_61690 [Catenulispora subtropica]|uniref:Uncharacterized protein n=1 Tax=Catenulispora subtropica TaxID=450798 RepID=A0ABP5E200_9ACTN
MALSSISLNPPHRSSDVAAPSAAAGDGAEVLLAMLAVEVAVLGAVEVGALLAPRVTELEEAIAGGCEIKCERKDGEGGGGAAWVHAHQRTSPASRPPLSGGYSSPRQWPLT